jgi:hypothetical protein
MNWHQIETRIKRLETLALEFAREADLVEKCEAPLHYRERRDYVEAILRLHAAADAARIVLAKARHRAADEGQRPV